MKKFLLIAFLVSTLLLTIQATQVSAAETWIQRPRFGHVLYVYDIKTVPETLAPGESGVLSFKIENIADDALKDLIIRVVFPNQVKPFNDINQKKIFKIESGETKTVSFDIVAMPNAAEGIYNATLFIDYINLIGDSIQENGTISFFVCGVPDLFVGIDSSEVYKGNYLGEVSVILINNGVADVKFMTVELQESSDYDIISPSLEYIGDLDSDDFDTVEFNIKVTSKEDSIILPLNLKFRDSLNREYNENVDLVLNMRTAEELGKSKDYTLFVIVVIVVLVVVGYLLYKKYKKKKLHK